MLKDRGQFFRLVTTVFLATGLAACDRNSNEKKVGGVWGNSPKEGETITNSKLEIHAYAYPAKAGDPPVAYVNFTGSWPGAKSPDSNNQNAWSILCKEEKPITNNEYVCSADLDKLGVPKGQKMTLSFDVYNAQGDKNLAPNGTREVLYDPSK